MDFDMKTRNEDSLQFAKALADETRQQIMGRLCCAWVNVNELVEDLGNVSQPTVSHHLRVLREAGLVYTRRDGKQVYYSLNQDAIAVCCGQLLFHFAPDKAERIPVESIPID
jgi:ArsR family transcriptional regulator